MPEISYNPNNSVELQRELLREAQATSAVTRRTLRVSIAALAFTVIGILVAILIALYD